MDSTALNSIPKFAVQMVGVPFFVGTFVMEWSKHEQLLAQLISLLEDREYGEVRNELLDGQIRNYENRLRAAIELLPDDHVAARIVRTEVLDAHVELREARHNVIHGHWASMSPDEEYLVRRKRRGEEPTITPMPLEKLMQLCAQLQAVNGPGINAIRAAKGLPTIDIPQ